MSDRDTDPAPFALLSYDDWTVCGLSERRREQEKGGGVDDDELMLNVLRCHLTY